MPETLPSSPYVGLQPYGETDRDFFFGREDETRIILSNLYAGPLTVLYGASGVGKSSWTSCFTFIGILLAELHFLCTF